MHIREREREKVGGISLCDVTRSGNEYERERKKKREPERERSKQNSLFLIGYSRGI